jgi:hypothetical protein
MRTDRGRSDLDRLRETTPSEACGDDDGDDDDDEGNDREKRTGTFRDGRRPCGTTTIHGIYDTRTTNGRTIAWGTTTGTCDTMRRRCRQRTEGF